MGSENERSSGCRSDNWRRMDNSRKFGDPNSFTKAAKNFLFGVVLGAVLVGSVIFFVCHGIQENNPAGQESGLDKWVQRNKNVYVTLPEHIVMGYENEVSFNDGVSGTVRGYLVITMPETSGVRLDIVERFALKSREDMEERLLRPVVSTTLRNTASLMSSQENIDTQEVEFVKFVMDQFKDGVYDLEEYEAEQEYKVENEETGKVETKIRTVSSLRIKKDLDTGLPVRYETSFKDAGIQVVFFKVALIKYSSVSPPRPDKKINGEVE